MAGRTGNRPMAGQEKLVAVPAPSS
jgi:hypothetical protein